MTIKEKDGIPESYKKAIKDMRMGGRSLENIADELGLTKEQVETVIKERKTEYHGD